mgnify:FL=1
MRLMSLMYCGALALGAAMSFFACAASGGERLELPSPDSGDGVTVIEDAGAALSDAPASEPDSSPIDGPTCSDAGWCRTELPDVDLVLKDIWPVGAHAFAVADSPTLGVKVLEWSDTSSSWQYIDDSSQNSIGVGKYAGRLWAPNENEVYYGVAPGYIYHGTRPVPPATTWGWIRHRLGGNSGAGNVDPQAGYPSYWKIGANYPALGVWGTSASDVYAWFSNTIYHWTSVDGGAPEWVPEYVADDASAATERMFFLAAAGTGPDGIWFAGARSRPSAACAVIVRKTSAGYERIADGALTNDFARCGPRAGSLLISGGEEGWLTDIQATSADRILGLKGGRDLVRISAAGDGYEVRVSPVPLRVSPRPLSSFWRAPDSMWLAGWGIVVRATESVWDGGAYEVSTISMAGAPLARPLYQVRGTSDTKLWAIGERNALHKTTP